jgi:hypothetical protein
MELANFVIGIVALMVAVVAAIIAIPPFAEFIFGVSKVKLRFGESSEQDHKLLLCEIHNLPIKSRFLRAPGITRSPAEVFASFDIREHGTDKIVGSAYRALLTDGRNADVASLTLMSRPGPPIVFVIVQHGDKGAATRNHAPMQQSNVMLPPGEYFADLKVAWGEAVSAAAKSFTVASSKDGTYWTERKIKEDW